MKWYSKVNSFSDQGLIVDEETSRNVAVSYDGKDAKLIATAPELLEALRSLTNCPDYKDIHTQEMKNALSLLYQIEQN